MLTELKVRVCTETLESAPFSLDMARLGNLCELLAHFDQVPDAALAECNRRILAQRAKRALAAEKKRKIQEMTRGAVCAWLTRIAGELGLPYQIDTIDRNTGDELTDEVIFFLLLENEMALSLAIPFAGFQDLLPRLADQVRPCIAAMRSYIASEKASAVRIGLWPWTADDHWITPTIERGEEQ
jgi:hypothetical protein